MKNTIQNPIHFASFFERLLAKALDVFFAGVLFGSFLFALTAGWFVVVPAIPEAQTTFNAGLVAEGKIKSSDIVDFWAYSVNWKGDCNFAAQEYQNACVSVVQFNKHLAISAMFLSILVWICYTVIPAAITQTTLGKYLIGLKISTIDGNKISILQSVAREIFAVIHIIIAGLSPIFAPLTSFANLLQMWIFIESYWITFSPKNQAIHDSIAQTYVIKNSAKN